MDYFSDFLKNIEENVAVLWLHLLLPSELVSWFFKKCLLVISTSEFVSWFVFNAAVPLRFIKVFRMLAFALALLLPLHAFLLGFRGSVSYLAFSRRSLALVRVPAVSCSFSLPALICCVGSRRTGKLNGQVCRVLYKRLGGRVWGFCFCFFFFCC